MNDTATYFPSLTAATAHEHVHDLLREATASAPPPSCRTPPDTTPRAAAPCGGFASPLARSPHAPRRTPIDRRTSTLAKGSDQP